MSPRFNHIFLSLMLISGASAFVVPPSVTDRLRGQADGLFMPVAYPVQRLAQTLAGAGEAMPNSALPGDPTPGMVDDFSAEVASLTKQLEELQRINALRDVIGAARDFSRLVRVVGADAGQRDALSIEGSAGDGLAVGMPALCEYGVVGKVTAVGHGGSQLRLITDRGFRTTGAIGAFVQEAGRHTFRSANLPPPLIEGQGGGRMIIQNLSMKQLADAGVKEGDWIVLDDREDWPLVMQGRLLGQIEKIEPQTRAQLFALVTVRPRVNLRQLREVMVVTGER